MRVDEQSARPATSLGPNRTQTNKRVHFPCRSRGPRPCPTGFARFQRRNNEQAPKQPRPKPRQQGLSSVSHRERQTFLELHRPSKTQTLQAAAQAERRCRPGGGAENWAGKHNAVFRPPCRTLESLLQDNSTNMLWRRRKTGRLLEN